MADAILRTPLASEHAAARVDVPDDVSSLVESIYRPTFPNGDLVAAAAGLFTADERALSGPLRNCPQWEILVAPGLVQVRTRNYSREERRAERQRRARHHEVNSCVAAVAAARGDAADAEAMEAGRLLVTGGGGAWSGKVSMPLDFYGPPAWNPVVPHPKREPKWLKLAGWSRKSRREFAAKIGRLELGPLVQPVEGLPGCHEPPAMITLTYPGDWLTACPNARTLALHRERFRSRFERKFGPIVGLWKLEFQRRGAPHLHMCMPMPRTDLQGHRVNFRKWLSQTWAECVDVADPQERENHLLAGTNVKLDHRMSDPKRVAEYFLKHGSGAAKEYQHQVPEEWLADGGSGRFWGVWGLQEVTSTVPVRAETGIAAGRIVRRWHRAQIRSAYSRPGEAGARARRYRSRLFVQNRGRVLVNDGAAFASQVARAVDIWDLSPRTARRRQ